MLWTRPDPRHLVRRVRSVSWWLGGSALSLSAIGLVVVSSAAADLDSGLVNRQAIWIGLGMAAMAAAAAFDSSFLLRYAVWIYVAALVLLVAVTFFGHEAGGARSWIGFGGFGGQPSDLCKIASALLLARHLAQTDAASASRGWLGLAALIVGLPVVLIAQQPDMGGALMFLPMLAAMVLVVGVRRRAVVGALVLAVAVSGAGWSFVLRDYQKDRLLSFVRPDADPLGSGYQVRQSKIAIGSGQLTGKGYGGGTQSGLQFLPAPHTDFVFAVLGEEYGFAGVAAVLSLFALYLANGARVALAARDPAGMLLAVGLLAFIAGHVLYNTAMVVGLLPITGIPLPFLSYGGSFMLFCCTATGLLIGLDVRRFVNRS